MLDHRLRATTERVLLPVADALGTAVSPLAVTATSVLACVGAGVAAWAGPPALAVALWLAGRALDGLDGVLARRRGSASDVGGYLDMLGDTVGYAAVPLGLGAAAADAATWSVVAVLLATFYVNALSWTYLSALLEKRAAGARATGERTSITMPVGVVEGAETFAFFTVALALGDRAGPVLGLMAVAVAVTAAQRARRAVRLLRTPTPLPVEDWS